MENSAPRPKLASSSLSRRLLWLTFAVVLLIQVLTFFPAITRARRHWLQERITHGQLALLSLDETDAATEGIRTAPPETPGFAHGETAAHRNLLRLAGVESARQDEPGRPSLTLGAAGQFEASRVIDLRAESSLDELRATLADLLDGRERMIRVAASGPVRPGATVAVVFHSTALTSHLRDFGREIAILGLVIAALTGLFIHFTLRMLLVRPMRRLTDSIAAFRSDPERTPPLETGGLTASRGDEVALAGHELAEMQRELRAALWRHARLAALGTAVAKVSHDLRSMLSPALLSAERLQSNPDPAVRRIGDTVVRAVERATDLMRSGLEFAREGPITVVKQRFCLREAVADAAEQARTASPHLTVENAIHPEVEINADREQIGRVLSNLIRNAGEAGASRVTIDTVIRPHMLEIYVSDNGPGLPKQVETALFKPFVTGGRRGSTGLGLAIARDLMRAHLGDVELACTCPQGTRFCLTLPATLSLKQPSRPTAEAAE